MKKARDDLRAVWLATVGCDTSRRSAVNKRMWRQKQTEFCERIAEVNVKVDRLNMIVPTLYQQIARFDADREQQVIVGEESCRDGSCDELLQSAAYQHQSGDDSSRAVTLTAVLRQIKQLFTT